MKVKKGSSFYEDETTKAVELLTDQKMQVVYYAVEADHRIVLTPNDYSVTTMFYILSGSFKVQDQKGTRNYQANDIFLFVDPTQSVEFHASEFSRVLAVTSEHNQSVAAAGEYGELIKKVEEKDKYTYGHSNRVSAYAMSLALSYDAGYNIVDLGTAAALHDLGKVYTPKEILQKPGKLTKEEFEIIKNHPADTYRLLVETTSVKIAEAAAQHHERLDGSGYPKGLKGEAISMDARIIAVADVFDAMTCRRTYNEPQPMMDVVAYLESQPEKYDARIVAILKRRVEDGSAARIMKNYSAIEN